MVENAWVIPSSVPHGRTARRLEWPHLPPHLRAAVEARCGSEVVDAESCTAGYTPGFASVLTCADGTRHFVKAASVKAQRPFAEAYRAEARKLAALPAAAPAPRLRWTHDRDDWVALGIEHVEARHPARPWRAADLTALLGVLARTAETLTPAPAGLGLDDIRTELAEWPAAWDHTRAAWPGHPHVEEAARLAARFPEVSAGDTVVHTDVRDDNVLLCTDGRVLLCDWNWPARGPAWLDSVWAMIGPRGDGLDVDAVLAAHPLTADVPAADVDTAIALILGYLFRAADALVPSTSPYLREAQRWQAEVCWEWLGERRGWT